MPNKLPVLKNRCPFCFNSAVNAPAKPFCSPTCASLYKQYSKPILAARKKVTS